MKCNVVYFAHTDSFEITEDGHLYLDLNGMVSLVEDEMHFVPIKRLSEKKDDYELDLSGPCVFYPTSSAIDVTKIEYQDYIGPFPISTVPVSKEAIWDRMTIDELDELLHELTNEGEKFDDMAAVRDIIAQKKAAAKNEK